MIPNFQSAARQISHCSTYFMERIKTQILEVVKQVAIYVAEQRADINVDYFLVRHLEAPCSL